MFEKLKNNERNDIDDEQRLHVIGYEKFSGIKLDDGEENMLNNYTNDGTIKGSLLYTASKILRKDQLSILEECAVELCLSSIINFVNPSVYSLILAEIDDSIVSKFRANATTIKGMEDDTNELFDNIIKHSQDTDDMLSFIQSTKSKLSKERKRGSEAYIMLSIVEHVVGNFNLWHVDGHESEITYYRRFAGLLDFLFENTHVEIADGETGSWCSRVALEVNKALFHVSDTSSTYSRKIDLLMKLNDNESVELSSSEWKKSNISETAILKQQSKNLKLNACILSILASKYDEKIKKIIAMDWIGTFMN